jgi:NAD(P)-dependent dehydrogenase (short-subunit alcohol dehydrogenase family)
MQIHGAVALVTGANRGLGRRFAEQLVERGAAKVYAAARHPETVTTPGVIPLHIDITDPDSVAAAAAVASDVTLLINNAGNLTFTSLLDGPLDDIRALMASNYFGTLAVTRAFAPHLIDHAPAAMLNVVSVLSWLHPGSLGAYAAAKTALWAQTDAVRDESHARRHGHGTARRLHGHRDGGGDRGRRHRSPRRRPRPRRQSRPVSQSRHRTPTVDHQRRTTSPPVTATET